MRSPLPPPTHGLGLQNLGIAVYEGNEITIDVDSYNADVIVTLYNFIIAIEEVRCAPFLLTCTQTPQLSHVVPVDVVLTERDAGGRAGGGRESHGRVRGTG